MILAALPLDVRQVSDLPHDNGFFLGYAQTVGPSPMIFIRFSEVRSTSAHQAAKPLPIPEKFTGGNNFMKLVHNSRSRNPLQNAQKTHKRDWDGSGIEVSFATFVYFVVLELRIAFNFL